MISTITMAVVPGSDADEKLSQSAKSGKPEPVSFSTTDGSMAYMVCIAHGPRALIGPDGSQLHEYILEAIKSLPTED